MNTRSALKYLLAASIIFLSTGLPASAQSNADTSEAACRHVRFSGELAGGQKFVHALPDNLEFRLLPYQGGWRISIGRTGGDLTEDEDYVGIATPPYYGVNNADIEAWHFRNAANTGPNQGDVNAPGELRDFSFVLNEAEYQKFFDALNLVEHVPDATEKQRDDARNFVDHGPRQHGTLTIVAMKLGGLVKGTQPWFESMKFRVDLCFPLSSVAP
jgi:hypothetical protein